MNFRLDREMDMPSIRRANLIRQYRRLSPDDVTGFGKIIGKSQSATSDLLQGRKSFGEKMARSIERNAGWPAMSLDQPDGSGNTEPGPAIRGRIPLISWVRAGAFCQTVDQFEPGDAEKYYITTQNLSLHAYCLRVKGDSMVNPVPGGHTYPEGSIIFVDPETAVTNGCRVIAKIPDADEATFKVYAEDAGKRWLKPLNPQYPMIEMTEGMMICGVVRAVLREE